jgi:hypothetical protein
LPDYLLHTTWTSWLPNKVQATLACHPEVELNAAAHCAYCITDFVPLPALVSNGQPIGDTKRLHRIEELPRQVAALSTEQKHSPLQLQPAAAHICTTATGCFITNKFIKQRFLIDTGSDLCAFPCKLIPQCWERVNYDLCVANGTTICTYGWLL